MNHDIAGRVFPGLDENLLAVIANRMKKLEQSLENAEIKIRPDAEIQKDLVKVLLFSEYIASGLAKNPEIFKELVESGDLFKSYSHVSYSARIRKKTIHLEDTASIKKILLHIKLYESIRIAWRDLTGKARLEETLCDLSNLADAVIDAALQSLYDDLGKIYGLPVDADGNFYRLTVLGMGKLGAHELNFSSDLDLIFVYPEQGYTNTENFISNEEFFIKLCRRFLKFFTPGMDEINFYRIDTRLRPYGEGGPLVMSAAGFEAYYQAQGREWERYAMIKARPVAGDIEAGKTLLKILNSFVYRRYFDYGSFDSFRDMKRRISTQVKHRKLQNNVKLGPGGIREIEFFGQLFQLIRGGVEPELQQRSIMKVLDLLYSHRCIDKAVSEELKHAYVFLRMVENRLQEYSDLQTHDIPENNERRLVLALSMNYDSWEKFYSDLNYHLDRVHYHFSQLLVSEDQDQADLEVQALRELWMNINDPQFTADSIATGRFQDPSRLVNILRSLEEHPNTKRLTPNGRKKLARLIPLLIRKTGQLDDPDKIISQLVDLVITIERRTCYLSLLVENKGALETLITLAEKSPWIISFLARHPALLDELMHPATLYFPPGRQALKREMAQRMERLGSDDLEILLEELCVFRQVNMLRVAAADVSGDYPLMKVSDHLTFIAETVLEQVLDIAWNIVIGKYGFPEGISEYCPENNIDCCGFAIIAYGKVGGLEMGYKSDIDIVFIHREGSDIDSVRLYSNLGQRIINALTLHTAAGTLYGADMRLRPGGNSGTIVSSMDGFEDYLENQAWTWEHQALIRARPVAGDKELGTRFEILRKAILTQPRDPEKLKSEVADMRERMRSERLKEEKGFFDLKQSRGGIVDIEFLVQFLVLKHSRNHPDLVLWTDNIRILESLDAEGIITGCQSERLQNAYILMRKTIHRLNLQEKPLVVPDREFNEIKARIIDIYDEYLGA
jgi:glutamate-ammonia-ligase adenylyltransferase